MSMIKVALFTKRAPKNLTKSQLIGLRDNAVNEEIARAFNITPPFRLEDFTYSNHKLLDVIFGHLENTFFNGITVGFSWIKY